MVWVESKREEREDVVGVGRKERKKEHGPEKDELWRQQRGRAEEFEEENCIWIGKERYDAAIKGGMWLREVERCDTD